MPVRRAIIEECRQRSPHAKCQAVRQRLFADVSHRRAAKYVQIKEGMTGILIRGFKVSAVRAPRGSVRRFVVTWSSRVILSVRGRACAFMIVAWGNWVVGGVLRRFGRFTVQNGIVSVTINVVVNNTFNGVMSSIINSVVVPTVNLLVKNMGFASLGVMLGRTMVSNSGIISPTISVGCKGFLRIAFSFVVVTFSVFVLMGKVGTLGGGGRRTPTTPTPPPTSVRLLARVHSLLGSGGWSSVGAPLCRTLLNASWVPYLGRIS